MWKFKNLEINGKVVLAPMAGVTSEGYRKFMHKFGVNLSYTEMVSDMGLIYDNDETNNYVDFDNSCSPCGVQLFGHDPITLAKAALICEKKNDNISFYDINMGCPVPKVTKPGSGSALMQNPVLCSDIIKQIKKVTNKPISAKIRLGYQDINFMDVIDSLQNAGVDMIAIHGRTRNEYYYGLPHYELLKNLQSKMSVPLVISGNIFTLDDAINALDITGAQAVMVARGGIGNPYLIKQISTYYRTGEKLCSSSLNDSLNYCLDLAKYLIEEKGEDKAIRIFKGIGPKFLHGFPHAKEFKVKMSTSINTYNDLETLIDEIRKSINDTFDY